MVTSGLRHLRIALVAAVLAALVVGPSAFAAPPGNNGTVKIHEGNGEPSAEIKNDPHVCTFHLHFYFADPFQAGLDGDAIDWWIDAQAPTAANPSILTGTYAAGPNGEDRTPELGLPIGHYKLSWIGRNDQNVKHKTFWVTCENEVGPINPDENPPT